MKIYYDYETNQILTKEEAKNHVKEDILDYDYSMWKFIIDNYSYYEILENLSLDFLDNIYKKLIKSQLENPNYFLVREIPD